MKCKHLPSVKQITGTNDFLKYSSRIKSNLSSDFLVNQMQQEID